MFFKKQKNGFTLIELLIVIGIIAILAAAVIIAINPGQQFAAARDATRQSHISSIKDAILSYQVDNLGSLEGLDITNNPQEICQTGASDCTGLADLSPLVPDYLSSIPEDPTGGINSDGVGYEVFLINGEVKANAPKAETKDIGVDDELSVSTASITNIELNSATAGGTVIYDGGSQVTDRGVCYSTTENPTTSDNCISDGTGIGSFSSSITGLDSNMTYYVRAYATNSEKTAYGSEVNFTTLENKFSLTVTSLTGGSAMDVTNSSPYSKDTLVDINATPDLGYVFNSWSTNDGGVFSNASSADTAYSMPANDATIVANFTLKEYDLTISSDSNGTTDPAPGTYSYGHGTSITITANPNTGYQLSNWSGDCSGTGDCTLTMDGDKAVTANFELKDYTLSYNAETGGSISGTTTQTVTHGSDGTEVTAVADSGYEFTGWSDGVSTASRTDTNITSDLSVTAQFEEITYPLSVNSTTGGSAMDVTNSSPYPAGTDVNINATPDSGYHFSNWTTSSGGSFGNATTADTTYTIPSNEATITANFALNEYTITADIGNGQGSVSPTSQTVTHGQDSQTITATPDTGYEFTNWTGDASGTANTYTFTSVTENKTATANFELKDYTLSYNAETGGSISGTTTQTVTHGSDGTEVTAVADSGYEFTGWSDGVSTASRTDTNITSDLSVTAQFAEDPNFSTTITSTNSPITEGDTLNVNTDITNTGGVEGTQTIILNVGGSQRDSQSITLSSGQTSSITLSWNTSVGDAGGYTATVSSEDSSDSASVTLETAWACGDPITDSRDGQSYSTVEINGQCWMAENLNIGTMLASASDTPSDNGTIEKWCYNNDTANCDTYGGLYDWNEMMQYTTTEGAQGICPDGWHVPTDDEQYTLENYLTADGNTCNASRNGSWDCDPAGGKLKQAGTTHWSTETCGSATCNSSGFTALPGGYRYTTDSFYNLGSSANFWSSSPGASGEACYRNLNESNSDVYRYDYGVDSGFSVRCIRD